MFSRKTVASVAVALMILVGAASARAGVMDLSPNSSVLDQINNLAAQASAAGGSSPSVWTGTVDEILGDRTSD